MGQSQSTDPLVVGGYGYNGCFECGVLNDICCGGTPQWYVGAICCGCTCDSMELRDPAWSPGSELRQQFEQRLRGPDMQLALNSAPTVCCGCKSMYSQADVLNQTWCARVNQELL